MATTFAVLSARVYDTHTKGKHEGDIIVDTLRTYPTVDAPDVNALQSALDEKRADNSVMAWLDMDVQNALIVKRAVNALAFDVYGPYGKDKDSYILGPIARPKVARVEVDLGSLK